MSELINVKLSSRKILDYEELLPGVLDKIKQKAKKLKGLKVAHVNATSLGGGVAEMLQSVVPLERDLGIDSRWYVIPPNIEFFEVTKLIHNFLQGRRGDLTPGQKKIYIEHNKLIARLLDKISADILVIHDPQPAAALTFMETKPKTAWRCHIDTSTPNREVWNFIQPYISKFDSLIFTMNEFINGNVDREKVFLMSPCIDPFTDKNRHMAMNDALAVLKSLKVDIERPLVTQVSRLDPWKDPKGVIDAYSIAKKEVPELQLAFVASYALDDPEGVRIAEEVKKYAKGKGNIKFFINLPNNDLEVNAFQTASDVILQKSTREGFALTVTEAMWKKNVVIGGNTGGIKLQIKDGKNGFLVNSSEEAAEKIVYTIKNPKKAKAMGEAAHRSVKENFLLPYLVFNELKMFVKLMR